MLCSSSKESSGPSETGGFAPCSDPALFWAGFDLAWRGSLSLERVLAPVASFFPPRSAPGVDGRQPAFPCPPLASRLHSTAATAAEMAMKENQENRRVNRPRSVYREYFEALVVAGIFLGFTNTFVLKTFFIPSASMEETLLIGDHLFVNRFVYGQYTGTCRSASAISTETSDACSSTAGSPRSTKFRWIATWDGQSARSFPMSRRASRSGSFMSSKQGNL